MEDVPLLDEAAELLGLPPGRARRAARRRAGRRRRGASFARAVLEGLRLDSFWLAGIRVPQAASVVGVAIAIAGLMWVNSRPRARGVTTRAT